MVLWCRQATTKMLNIYWKASSLLQAPDKNTRPGPMSLLAGDKCLTRLPG